MIDNRTAPYAATLLRVSLGVMFIAHALLKLLVFTLPGSAQFFDERRTAIGLGAAEGHARALLRKGPHQLSAYARTAAGNEHHAVAQAGVVGIAHGLHHPAGSTSDKATTRPSSMLWCAAKPVATARRPSSSGISGGRPSRMAAAKRWCSM